MTAVSFRKAYVKCEVKMSFREIENQLTSLTSIRGRQLPSVYYPGWVLD